MIARLIVALAMLCAAAASAQPLRVVYVGLDRDPYYEPQPLYTGLSLKDRARPVDGARLAARGARIMGRALGLTFGLDEILLAPGQSPAAALRAALDGGAAAALLDLPADLMARAVAAALPGDTLINIRDKADRWRGADCAPALLHAMPSRAMLADALAQHLRRQGWDRILLLRGDGPDDAEDAEAAARAAAKFGLTIVATRDFALTNDPRRRDLSNIKLLSGRPAHDVIWLVDGAGEFGRYVPYATQSPRPVVGTEGLTARAWHWTWERNGAPQLNQRFRRLADRDMDEGDFAAWAGMRAVIEAGIAATKGGAIRDIIRSEGFALDLYKGVRGGFRPWDGQLRQPILLVTHNAVIAAAPLDGFEHQRDTLDTLGVDARETACTR
ncbi:MAG: ABC transporter substrate binding protein (PQQ-dependent alcohol dehydrogenase system) [Paracoccaceae bacterium]|jgi:ABC transporter substrate binding protein (PQQ-dependent alcohol dehydrogenase system)